MSAEATPSICHELDAADAARRFHQAGGYYQPAYPTNPPTRTPTMQLFRAVAYRLQRANTPPGERWPEMAVFFEADNHQAAAGRLADLLSVTWDCRPADIDHYNLASEAELISGGCFGDFKELGDAALLVNGWFHGPLFCRVDRTLMLVSPPVLARLQLARRLAHPHWMAQRSAEAAVAERDRMQSRMRHTAQRERMEGAHATGFGSL